MTEIMRTLGNLKPGQGGMVLRIAGGNSKARRSLIDMGITPGTLIRVKKIAPMGDPMEITLRGYELSLRRSDAMSIQLMDPDQEEAFRVEEERIRREYEKKGREALGEHGVVRHASDMDEHRRAARMTERMLEQRSIPCGKGKRKRACAAEAFPNSEQPVRLALAGNPNCGKTTLFNAMTGAREYVGNWPGVTVEKKEGRVKSFKRGKGCPDGLCTMGHEMTLVDLPGIYSLSPHTMEEIVARNYIIQEKPDAIINIVDGTNLERNLYLTIQLMELEKPMIIALNMMDEVEKNGDYIDCKALSLELGIPVVPISARTGRGIELLIESAQKLIHAIHTQYHEGFRIEPDDVYDDFTHMTHHRIGDLVNTAAARAGLPLHWTQIKLLEGDEMVLSRLKLSADVQARLNAVIHEYAKASQLGDNESRVADSRYRYISRVTARALARGRRPGEENVSDRIDSVLTHKALAIPIFILVMGLIFFLTFSGPGAFLSDVVAGFIDQTAAPFISGALNAAHAPQWFVSLVIDGIFAGVGGVLTFLPQIALLFLCLSLLEDSGYMSRIAFIMDKPMRRFGLSGKSFIPLLMGFGCTVPAAMGARTMENERDKRMTIMLLPFMSCSAKLPVYGLLAGAFFSKGRGLVIISLYVLGIIAGILSGLLFKKTLFKGNDAAFLIELPPYRLPKVKNVLLHVWERVAHFLEKAGTIIFAMSVAIWFLENYSFSFRMVTDASQSMLGALGGVLAPLLAPLGFGTWQAAVALLAGFVAKEAVVSAMAMFYGFTLAAGDGAVHAALSGAFTPLSAYSFLVFVLLYTPCMAAVATIRRELNSAKWTALTVGYQLGAAYLASLLVYQIGGLFVS